MGTDRLPSFNKRWVFGWFSTAATNALDHDADIAKVQEWLGHANIATTRIYDRRKMRPEQGALRPASWSERRLPINLNFRYR